MFVRPPAQPRCGAAWEPEKDVSKGFGFHLGWPAWGSVVVRGLGGRGYAGVQISKPADLEAAQGSRRRSARKGYCPGIMLHACRWHCGRDGERVLQGRGPRRWLSCSVRRWVHIREYGTIGPWRKHENAPRYKRNLFLAVDQSDDCRG